MPGKPNSAPIIDNSYFESEEALKDSLKKIEAVFDTDAIVNKKMDTSSIQQYFIDSNLGYRLVHSKEGSVHMAINYNNVFDKEGYYQQAIEINEYIQPGAQVLELGCGKGFNTSFLAGKNPGVGFIGIDISKKHLGYANEQAKGQDNLEFRYGDFHKLEFEDNTFDVVFELEAVCYTDRPATVLSEVNRVLKKGGRFILYDGFRTKDFDNLTDTQKKSAALIEKTMAVNTGHVITEWLETARACGFEVTQNDDISLAIMPNLRRFYRLAGKYYKYRFLSKLVLAIMPTNLIKNTITGLLFAFSIMQKMQSYNRIVLTKK